MSNSGMLVNLQFAIMNVIRAEPGWGEGATALYGLFRYVRPQMVSFSAVLVINRVDFGCFVINRVSFLQSSLDMGMFLRKSHF